VICRAKRDAKSPFIFVSEQRAPFSVSRLEKMVERAGVEAKMPFKVHPHMFRHATGFALANKGTDTRTLQAYLGHRTIQSTVRYTELALGRFKNIWRESPALAGGLPGGAAGAIGRGIVMAPLASEKQHYEPAERHAEEQH
jgi:site-specific recombinase XerD